VWNALRVKVPFYRGWERGSSCGKGGGMTGVDCGGGEWRLRPLKLVKARVEGG
jgi:hypothetical protein